MTTVQAETVKQYGVPGPTEVEVQRKFYPGIDKESMWFSAQEDDELKGMDERAMDRFRRCMSELTLYCTVNLRSGEVTVHSVEGVDLEEGLVL